MVLRTTGSARSPTGVPRFGPCRCSSHLHSLHSEVEAGSQHAAVESVIRGGRICTASAFYRAVQGRSLLAAAHESDAFVSNRMLQIRLRIIASKGRY